MTWTDRQGFRYQAWIVAVQRSTTGGDAAHRIAPPDQAFLEITLGVRNMQSDRPAAVPGAVQGEELSVGESLPFRLLIPSRDLPGMSADSSGSVNCYGYGSAHYSGYVFDTPADNSGCLAGLETLGPGFGIGEVAPTMPPNGSTTVLWEAPPLPASAPLSDLSLVADRSHGVTASGTLSLQS